jgi:diacylglycerol O-acyltransferase / trehalose O-mycolyltransferase
VLLVVLFLISCGAPSSSPTPAATTPPASTSASASPTPTVGAAARIVATKKLSSRSADLTIESPAVGDRVQVRLLLPAHFESQPKRRWPVLYLLHGCCDTDLSWSRSTDIEQLTRKRDLLVVMPDGGKVGFYSNWRTGPQWETFHTQELPQLLASQYRANGKAAIAGVSMGGVGALGYAARHPGMYSAAASFSGIVHTRLSSDVSQGYLGLVSSQGTPGPLALWGDPEADAAAWKQHNPYDLAPQLTRIPLFISAGNGDPGPLDESGTAPTPSSPRSTPRTRSLSKTSARSAPASQSTYTATARTTGCTGNASCIGHGPSSPPNWNRREHTEILTVPQPAEVSASGLVSSTV